MADYSKEFVDKHFEDPQFSWDFEIAEIGASLEKDHIYPVICEGYGFLGIYRDSEGMLELVFEHPTDDLGVEMVPLDELDKRYVESSLPWQRMRGRK